MYPNICSTVTRCYSIFLIPELDLKQLDSISKVLDFTRGKTAINAFVLR